MTRGILFFALIGLLIIGCSMFMDELKQGERDGIINNGYVGEDKPEEDDEA